MLARHGERGKRIESISQTSVMATASRIRGTGISATKPGAGLVKFLAMRAGAPVSMAIAPSQISPVMSEKVIMPNQSNAFAAPRRSLPLPVAASRQSGTSAGRIAVGLASPRKKISKEIPVAVNGRIVCGNHNRRRSSHKCHNANGISGQLAHNNISRWARLKLFFEIRLARSFDHHMSNNAGACCFSSHGHGRIKARAIAAATSTPSRLPRARHAGWISMSKPAASGAIVSSRPVPRKLLPMPMPRSSPPWTGRRCQHARPSREIE